MLKSLVNFLVAVLIYKFIFNPKPFIYFTEPHSGGALRGGRCNAALLDISEALHRVVFLVVMVLDTSIQAMNTTGPHELVPCSRQEGKLLDISFGELDKKLHIPSIYSL